MLLTNLARNYRNLNPEQYNCEMNGGSKSNQFTCHLAVPSAVCSSRRSSAAVGPPPVTPAASGSPPLLSCTHILYTDSILRRHQNLEASAPDPRECNATRNGENKRRDAPVGGFLDLLRGEEEGVLLPAVERRRHTRLPDRNREPRSTPLEREREGSDSGFPTGGWVARWGNGASLALFTFPPAFARRYFLPGARLVAAYYCVALRRGPWAGGRRARGNAAAALALPCWERGYSAAVWDATHDCYHQIIRLRLYCQAVAIGNACVFRLVLSCSRRDCCCLARLFIHF